MSMKITESHQNDFLNRNTDFKVLMGKKQTQSNSQELSEKKKKKKKKRKKKKKEGIMKENQPYKIV